MKKIKKDYGIPCLFVKHKQDVVLQYDRFDCSIGKGWLMSVGKIEYVRSYVRTMGCSKRKTWERERKRKICS
jgi:ABC-type molybdate transport system ATPase subunit